MRRSFGASRVDTLHLCSEPWLGRIGLSGGNTCEVPRTRGSRGRLRPRHERADRLRLRPPTVVHHLNKLRLAGLVRIELQADGERRYVLRRAGLETAIHNLDTFLSKPDVSDH